MSRKRPRPPGGKEAEVAPPSDGLAQPDSATNQPSHADAGPEPAGSSSQPSLQPPRARPRRRRINLRPIALRAASAVGWLGLAVVLSVGVAGLTAGASHLPGSGDRAELTWDGDQAIAPTLDDAAARLGELTRMVDRLGELGRSALADLVASNTQGMADAIISGQSLLDDIESNATAIQAELAGLPGTGATREIWLSSRTITRYERMTAAPGMILGLRDAWERLSAGSVPATRLIGFLQAHDASAAAAAQAGSQGLYAVALVYVSMAKDALTSANGVRDTLSSTVDVAVLAEWIARNSALDGALEKLYTALHESGGQVNDAVRAAFAESQTAQEHLPPDTRAMVAILGDIARGGLNQAVIAVEVARGRLATATAALD